jgi:hypothetical protein
MLNLLFIIVVFLIVVYIISWMFNGTKTLSNYASAQTQLTIPPDSLPAGASVNYSYSIWIYIDDWSYQYGTEKIIFIRGAIGSTFMPALSLSPIDNNAVITVSLEKEPFECVIPNIPLQKWTNLIVSLNNKSLDGYVNGKLVKTCVLPSIPTTDPTSSLYLTPQGGFSGYTARFNYWSDAMSPQQAWNVYKSGPGGNPFSNFLNQYKVQLSFLKGNDVKASLTI